MILLEAIDEIIKPEPFKVPFKDNTCTLVELGTGKVINKPLSSILKARHFFSSLLSLKKYFSIHGWKNSIAILEKFYFLNHLFYILKEHI